MSDQNQYEVSAQKWLDRARDARDNDRRQEALDSNAIGSIYQARGVAERQAERAAQRIANDASYSAIEAVMAARATQVATNTAIGLIEHMEDDFTPVELVDALKEQTVSMLVQRSGQPTSSSVIATEQRRLEVIATVEIARIVGVK